MLVDDSLLLRPIETFLRCGGYSLITAVGPSETLEESREFSCDIHPLLTDVTMPEMDGLTMAELILAERMQIRVLLMSGLPSVISAIRIVWPGCPATVCANGRHLLVVPGKPFGNWLTILPEAPMFVG